MNGTRFPIFQLESHLCLSLRLYRYFVAAFGTVYEPRARVTKRIPIVYANVHVVAREHPVHLRGSRPWDTLWKIAKGAQIFKSKSLLRPTAACNKKPTWPPENKSEGGTTSNRDNHVPVPIHHRPILLSGSPPIFVIGRARRRKAVACNYLGLPHLVRSHTRPNNSEKIDA